jgi:virginiamycin B lyase
VARAATQRSYARHVISVARLVGTALGLVVTTLACATAAGATVTTWPTCLAVPLTGDSALCSSGRSPQQIAAGPDGGLWFTAASSEVGRMSTSGGLSLVTTPGTGTRLPQSITLGPDGALWYVDAFGPTLGRVTTAFGFSTFADAGYRPEGVATGPDGGLWVVEAPLSAVARFSTTGAISRFALPPKSTAPESAIARGPDDRLWFTGRKALGAITTAGAISSYPLPGPSGGCPSALATRKGERIWFADFCRDRVGSATPAGAIDWYSFPGGGPGAIAFGPDGDLWIGLDKTGEVVRMTPAGTVLDLIALLYAPQFGGFAAGPDGNMWFTEITTPQIGRIDVPGATPIATRAAATGPGAGAVEQAPPSLQLLGARVRGASIEIAVRSGEAGRLEARAALVDVRRVRLRPGGPGLRLRPTPLGHSDRTAIAGRQTLRVALSSTARRAIARARRGSHAATIEVAVRLRTTAKRVTSRQRRVRLP